MRDLEAVLVVSASAGSGHLRAGEALSEALIAGGRSRRVEHVDVLELAPRWVRAAYAGSFELMAQRAPWLWREVYARTVVMGGGLRLGIEGAVHDALRANVPNLHVIAVCGRNAGAQSRLIDAARLNGRLHVLGYTRAIERIAAVADVIVTKAGGLTASEALALGCPLILTRALPGHEEENARTLVGAGVALTAVESGVGNALEMMFESPRLRAHMIATATALGKPYAAHTVVAYARGLESGRAA